MYNQYSSCIPVWCKYNNSDQLQQLLKFRKSAFLNILRFMAVIISMYFFQKDERALDRMLLPYKILIFLLNVVVSVTGLTFFIFHSSFLYATKA